MRVIRIVLTGGPCAGKTTMLNLMKDYLDRKDIPCLVIPETATELINGNLKPYGTYEEIMRFQDAALNKQLTNEEIFSKYALAAYNDSDLCVIIHDRGLFDNKAYFAETRDFELMLRNYGLTEIDYLDRYDLVLDLISTAVCKPEAYCFNNAARYESLEEAVALDAKTTNVWLGHRNMKIIPTFLDIEEEKKIILDYLEEIVYNKQEKRISRFDITDFSNLEEKFGAVELSDPIDIKDTWLSLSTADGVDCIVSKRTYKGHNSYTMRLQKEEDDSLVTVYDDRKITEGEYSWFVGTLKNIKAEEKKEMSFVNNLKLYKVVETAESISLEIEKLKYDESNVSFNDSSNIWQKVKH